MFDRNTEPTKSLKHLLIFDLDGVITSEEAYWDCTGLTLHELLFSPRYWNLARNTPYQPAASARESREISRATLPEWLILSFKARALNSNWDTCYAAVCLHLVALLSRLPDQGAMLQPFEPWDTAWLAALRAHIAVGDLAQGWDITQLHAAWHRQHPFDLPAFHNSTGLALFERVDAYASETLGYSIENVFSRHRPFWRFCRDLFQEWLLGDTLYTDNYGHAPAQTGKPGCIYFEEPLLPVEQTRATLEQLREAGYTLGIASGRVRQEATQPLQKADLWRYFDELHLATYDVVVWGESALRKTGVQTTLGKPHPFQFQAAVDRERALGIALGTIQGPPGIPFIAVGDSTSDILSAQAAGGLTVAVLTGARSPEARELLLKSQPDFVIEDITKLPALLEQIESLASIQKLQFERREVAEKLLHLWFTRHMNLAVTNVRLTPKAVSLNSFNGFFTSEQTEYFFKTHVEEHGVLNEYYHAQLLDRAGYRVVRPLHLLREKERQMVIYPVVHWPTMFDLMRAVETNQALPAGISAGTLIEAERAECRRLLQIYAHTFHAAQNTETAPIHQLFWHRLHVRFNEFYVNKVISLPGQEETTGMLAFEQILRARWVINGVEQTRTLGELVQQARRVLDPARITATIVGHGDAHFGNVFLFRSRMSGQNDVPDLIDDPAQNKVHREKYANTNALPQQESALTYQYVYFDPAFAGRHAPLLDIVKPLFHNVFAMWMYFPHEIARDLHLSVKREGERLIVEHTYRLTAIRRALLQAKREELLKPLLAWLEEQDALPEDWLELLNLALMCCPLLTVNLVDTQKRPPEIGWLGLTQAVQLGNAGLAAWEDVL